MSDRDYHSKPCACCFRWADVDCWAFWLCLKCHEKWLAAVGVPPNNARWEPKTNAAQATWQQGAVAWLEGARVH